MKRQVAIFWITVFVQSGISERILAQAATNAGSALILNGTNQYVEIPYDSSFNVGPFT